MLTSFFGRVLFLISAIIFCVLQSLLWMGDGGILDTQQIKEDVANQKAEVDDLKSGTEAIEGHARSDLGMIQEGETFFLVTATPKPSSE
jgi:cell division protein FtsB